MKKYHLVILLFLLVLVFSLFVRFYKFDSIPGEWFGDISNVHEYVFQIVRGEWPFYFFQSPGPLYHYLIVPIVLLYANHGFETYKMASIAVSLLGLVTTYLFVAEISSKKLALLATLTMSFSFWYLIWSRLGNSQIVIPALVSLMSLFIARYINRKKFKDLFFAAVSASLGWYAYPQTFILPVVFFIFLVFYFLRNKKLAVNSKRLLIVLLMLVIMAIPFVNIVSKDKGNFGPKGYVGGKILGISGDYPQMISKTWNNYEKVMLMLHVRGDSLFRINVSRHPQLDAISGIFFFLGFLYFAGKKRRIWLLYILFMLFVLPLPSILPSIPDAEIPSSSRTIAIVPFVFLLIGAGILQAYQYYNNTYYCSKNCRYLFTIVLSLIFAYMVFTNLKLYFADYANGLPDKNFASGKIIANYIDNLPKNINVYFGSCCWGRWGHPEPKAVAYVLRKPRNFIEYNHFLDSCSEVTKFPAVIIFGPKDDKKLEEYKKCFPGIIPEDIKGKNGEVIFKLINI